MENLDSNSGEVISGSKISIDEHEGYLKRSQLKAGDILFSIAGTLGRIGIIKSSILPANTNQALAIIRAKEGNVNYISTVLRGRAVTDFIHRNPTVGAQPNLSLEQVGDLEIPYPSLDEQKKIGDYFKRLDHLITLHQYKQNMIFYEKSTILAYFWEQRKVGDCFTERVESMPDGELISVTINDGIKKFSELGRHDNSNDDKSKYKKVCVGDIAYNSMRMWQGASGYSPYEGIVSPAYTVLSPNSGINSKCLAYQFKLPEMIHTFQVNSQGITSDNWNLKYPALSQIEIFVSNNEHEQAKIAEHFEILDNLITLHQRKIKYILKECLYGLF